MLADSKSQEHNNQGTYVIEWSGVVVMCSYA